jgi:hypothetical protein
MNIGRPLRVCLFATLCFLTYANAFAQSTRIEAIEQEKAEKAMAVGPEQREKGDVIVTKLENLLSPQPPAWRLTFGDFRPGAGFAAGVGYAAPVGGRGLWDTKAAWSIKNSKQVESTLSLPLLTGDRVHVNPFVRWNDETDLSYFGLGNGSSPKNEVSYGLRSVEVGAEVEARAGKSVRYGAGLAYLDIHSRRGHGSEPEIGNVFTNVSAPGLGANPSWVHSSVHAAIDTRESPGYTTRGGLVRVALHQYTDHGGQFSFRRAEIDVRRFVPVLHNNWIVALQGHADLTDSPKGHTTPYFMLPSIGGRDTLPGFQEYRFTDKHSLLLRTELRWTASPFVDMAVFLDQGKVAPRVGDLNLRDLRRGWGIGARVHGSKFTALRLEVAHSVEGWRYNIAQGISF